MESILQLKEVAVSLEQINEAMALLRLSFRDFRLTKPTYNNMQILLKVKGEGEEGEYKT